MIKIDYTDSDGLRRRVLVKSEYDNPEKGIPCDIFEVLKEFYADASSEFRMKLFTRLWDVGLIEPHHLASADANKKYRQALNSSLARDSVDAIRFVMNILEK